MLLLVDPHSGVGVRALPGLVSGVAQGVAGSDELRVDLELNDPPIKVGDVVVTSGEEQSDFPEGLMVGTITKIEPEQAGLGTIVRVKPFTDFDALEYVTVLEVDPGPGSGDHDHDDHHHDGRAHDRHRSRRRPARARGTDPDAVLAPRRSSSCSSSSCR